MYEFVLSFHAPDASLGDIPTQVMYVHTRRAQQQYAGVPDHSCKGHHINTSTAQYQCITLGMAYWCEEMGQFRFSGQNVLLKYVGVPSNLGTTCSEVLGCTSKYCYWLLARIWGV